MGLDSVELVVEIEEAFGVDFPDEAAERMQTPGEVFDHLVANGFEFMREGCLTRSAFYRLRGGIASLWGHDRRTITPSARLDRIVAAESPRAGVARLVRAVGLRSPGGGRKDLSTMGELARDVAAANYGLLAKQKGEWREEELWESLRRVIARRLGLPLRRITRRASFVDDLGVD